MKKIILFVMLSLVIVGCQKKEEPKASPEYPAGTLRTQDTLRIAEDAVKTDPKNVNAWVELGNILMDSRRFGEAVGAYQKALELDPKNVDVRVDMGTCYRNSGKPDMAMREYKKALEINPNHLLAHMNLGVVYAYDLKDKAQAIKEFEKYLQLAPNARNAEQVKQQIEKLKASR
ncbi:MAG: tetratricopeptide repeat protein [Nitrospirae bacterium]|nr:tetratricopeptide repeat protein [Nitrospirota bacterium]